MIPVYPDGTLCLDIIQDEWKPVYTVSTILSSIQSLLTDPNIDSPANVEAARVRFPPSLQYNVPIKSYTSYVHRTDVEKEPQRIQKKGSSSCCENCRIALVLLLYRQIAKLNMIDCLLNAHPACLPRHSFGHSKLCQ